MKGKRAIINHIEYKGMTVFDSKKIQKLFFARFSKKHFFDASQIKQATENLLEYYVQNGFWDAAIVKRVMNL
jgi:outer membrane protein assembly factor BamA